MVSQFVPFLRRYAWGVFLLIALLNVAVVFLYVTGLGDFGSFYVSGQAARAGLNPYATDSPLIFRPDVFGEQVVAVNLNPPVVLPLCELLSLLDPQTGLSMWRLFSLACYMAAAALVLLHSRRYATLTRITWYLSIGGLYHVLEMGQIYAPLSVLVAASYVALERRKPLLAGLCIGVLVAIKPNFAVWPAALLLAGAWQTAVASAVAASIMWLFPLVRYGPQVYRAWLSASHGFGGVHIPGNASFIGLCTRLGQPRIGYILAVVCLVLLAWWIKRSNPSGLTIHVAALSVSLLASPIAWAGYLLILAPLLLAIPFSRLSSAGAVLMVTPFPVMYALGSTTWGAVPFGFLYGWALLLILASTVFRPLSSGYAVVSGSEPVEGREALACGADHKWWPRGRRRAGCKALSKHT